MPAHRGGHRLVGALTRDRTKVLGQARAGRDANGRLGQRSRPDSLLLAYRKAGFRSIRPQTPRPPRPKPRSAPVAVEAGDEAVEGQELEHAHCLGGHVSIDLKTPAVSAGVVHRLDQSVEASAVDEIKLREVQAD